MNLRTLQLLFVLSWLAWACMPAWGATAFAAMEVTLLFGLGSRQRQAVRELETTHAEVKHALDEPQQAWLAKYAFFYTQRPAAREWAGLLRASALALMLLIPVFAVHALVRRELLPLVALLPAVIFIVLNSMLAPSLEVDDWTKEDGREAEKALHDAVTKAVAARALKGLDLSALPARLGAPGGLAPPPAAPPPTDPPED
ncbi:MAG: hypothetical protein JNJ54_26070 [Myxococcaceae bacterium]|nr:hypothetical protein [Myxococcaceae bacterium]